MANTLQIILISLNLSLIKFYSYEEHKVLQIVENFEKCKVDKLFRGIGPCSIKILLDGFRFVNTSKTCSCLKRII